MSIPIGSRDLDRRSFLARTTSGLGAIALAGAAGPLMKTVVAAVESHAAGGKKLIATTDYYDNIVTTGRFYERSHLDALHRYLASLGVVRHQWIVDSIWNLYDESRERFDLLAQVVESAHAHGIECYAEIKPFEGGCFGEVFPASFPLPPGAVAVRDIRGVHPIVRPFVARHPEMCLQRRPGTPEFRGPPATIRLVKNRPDPTRVKREHLSIWSSSTNNRFIRYEGPITFRETLEWRPLFPSARRCRVLHMEKLALPADHRYLLIRSSLADDAGDFTHECGSIVELENAQGEPIPFLPGSGLMDPKKEREKWNGRVMQTRRRLLRYLQLPEVKAIFDDPKAWEDHFRDAIVFEDRSLTGTCTLDKEGVFALACGKPEYMLGNLHPVYPEVRAHWLDLMRHCLDRGVDGMNIRQEHHTRSSEPWEYGFNAPAIRAAGGKTDHHAISRVNGDAYTGFLREARELTKSRGKKFTVHLNSQMIAPDDRGYASYLPLNFDWQWETWVNDIADDLEFRKYWTLRSWNLRPVLEKFIAVTDTANKPFYLQGRFRELSYEGPNHRVREEIELMKAFPGIDGYVLYETAYVTRIDQAGELEGSPDLAAVIKSTFPKSKVR